MKIGIVGSGFVGSTAAFALLMRGIGREIVLIDLDRDRAQAEADDLFHAVPFAHPLEIRAGDYDDLRDCRVVILTAGVNQRPGEARLELLTRNASVFKSIIPEVVQRAPEAILVVATNPVDVMTHLAARYASQSGIPSARVLGSGTTLDTARFRALLGRYTGVDAQHVHAYVVGEHGDSEVLTWSLAAVGGIPLEQFCRQKDLALDAALKDDIDERVRRAAARIISGKHATYYGIGSALARIVAVILADQRAVLTVCTPAAELVGVKDVTVSVPRLVGGAGVLDTLPLSLDDAEQDQLRASAELIAAVIRDLK